MECTVWEEYVSALVDGELGDGDTASLFAHLAQCGHCRRFLKRLTQLREELMRGAWSSPRVPGEAVDQGRRAEKAVRLSRKAGRWSAPVRVSRALAVAAVLALVMLGSMTTALLLERRSRPQEARVIYIMKLPTVEVEASYLPNSTSGM